MNQFLGFESLFKLLEAEVPLGEREGEVLLGEAEREGGVLLGEDIPEAEVPLGELQAEVPHAGEAVAEVPLGEHKF